MGAMDQFKKAIILTGEWVGSRVDIVSYEPDQDGNNYNFVVKLPDGNNGNFAGKDLELQLAEDA